MMALRQGGTPTDIIGQLTSDDFHVQGYPREIIDKAESQGPFTPVRQAKIDSPLYEVFAFAPVNAGITDARRGGDALAAGSRGTVRASFLPERWRVYFYSAVASAIVWFAPGPDAYGPAEFVANDSAASKSDTLELPARSVELSFYVDAANTGVVWLVLVAERGVGTLPSLDRKAE